MSQSKFPKWLEDRLVNKKLLPDAVIAELFVALRIAWGALEKIEQNKPSAWDFEKSTAIDAMRRISELAEITNRPSSK